MPGTISRMGGTRAAARAGSTASGESGSGTARQRGGGGREVVGEEEGREGGGRGGRGVREVGHLAREPFPVRLDQGQGPQALARRPAGPEETGLEPLVVRHGAGAERPEGDGAR